MVHGHAVYLGRQGRVPAIRGKWIVELGELDSFNKAESTKAKQFFSASIDTYRESYGRRTSDVPRQCVFAGTTNQDEYLKDATGNRRYWPVACVKVDLEALRRVRDQLWAEAMFCYQAGDIWWATREEEELFTTEQEERFVVDEWEGPILKWLEESQVGETVTGSEVLGQALNPDPGHWGKPEQMRVGSIMHRLGWRRRRLAALPKSGKRPWAYQKPEGWGAPAPGAATASAEGGLLLIKHIDEMLKLWALELHAPEPCHSAGGVGSMLGLLIECKGDLVRGTRGSKVLLDESADIEIIVNKHLTPELYRWSMSITATPTASCTRSTGTAGAAGTRTTSACMRHTSASQACSWGEQHDSPPKVPPARHWTTVLLLVIRTQARAVRGLSHRPAARPWAHT